MADIQQTIARLRELETKATEAPWQPQNCGAGDDLVNVEAAAFGELVFAAPGDAWERYEDAYLEASANAALTAEMRNALPALLQHIAYLERLQKHGDVVCRERDRACKQHEEAARKLLAAETRALQAEARAERMEAEKLHAIGEYGLAYLRNERLEAALRETARECASSEKESKLEGNRSEAQLFRNIRDFVMEKLDAALATAQPKEADDV